MRPMSRRTFPGTASSISASPWAACPTIWSIPTSRSSGSTAPDIPRLLFNKPSGNMMGAAAAGGGMMQGNWVASHYEDINRIYCDNEHFSNKGTAEFQRLIGETFPSIPLGLDPPEHTQYRMFLTQFLGPATITRVMEPMIREVLDEMVGEIAGQGRSRHGLGFRPGVSGAHLHGDDGLPQGDVRRLPRMGMEHPPFGQPREDAVGAAQRARNSCAVSSPRRRRTPTNS